MSELYGVVGTKKYEQLLADPQGADLISVPCKPGNGSIARGTILYRETSGLYSPAAAAQVTASNMLVVLNEDVETGSAPKSGETATAEDAAAFRAGCFVDGKVTLDSGAVLTAANKVILRQQGIVFDKAENTETFTNTVSAS